MIRYKKWSIKKKLVAFMALRFAPGLFFLV
jgi:hypothetical protein